MTLLQRVHHIDFLLDYRSDAAGLATDETAGTMIPITGGRA